MRLVYRTEYRNSYFLGRGARLLQISSLRRGANSKPGAYLKLGANLSIYGMNFKMPSNNVAMEIYI